MVDRKSIGRLGGVVALILVATVAAQKHGPSDLTRELEAATAKPPAVRVQSFDGTEQTVEYQGARWLQDLVIYLSKKKGGGTLTFEPRVYEFRHPVRLWGINNVHFIGVPGTIFRLRKLDEWAKIKLSRPSRLADLKLAVDRPDLLQVGSRYQLLRPDLKKIRLMEFDVASKDGGDVVGFDRATNIGIDVAPVGSWIIPHLNHFDCFRSGNMTFQSIEFDGNFDMSRRALGEKLYWGHTTHCALLFRNSYKPTAARPGSRNVRVLNCTFKNLLGRGATFYNMADLTIRDCHFENLAAEAIEIDHLSAFAVIGGCTIRDVKFGMRLNDCTDTTVTGCIMENCRQVGIYITEVVKDGTCNRRMTITGNVIRGGLRGIVIDSNAEENIISSNTISDARWIGIDVKGSRNVVMGNSIARARRQPIDDKGEANVVVNNQIIPASGRGG